jgi:methyl-accepting chemotaxis protein
MKFKDIKMQNKILLAVLAPLSLLLVLVAITIATITTMLESSERVDFTYDILQQSSEISASSVDMETGMRGFLLNGNEVFLEPYTAGNKKVFTLITNLKKKVAHNTIQVQRLNRVESILTRWKSDVATQNIKLRREIGEAASVKDLAAMVAEGKGKALFDQFRDQVKIFIDNEIDLLKKRHDEFTKTVNDSTTNFDSFDAEFELVNRAHEITDLANSLLASAINMETGERGFLLTGQENFLGPYYSGEKNFKSVATKLEILAQDNPPQVKRVKQAAMILEEWKNKAGEPALELRKQVNKGKKPLVEIETFVASQRGKKPFDNLRSKIDEIITTELKLLALRKETVAKAKKDYRDNSKVLISNENWVSFTNDVIRKSYLLLSAALDMETGERGFMLTGTESFLEPYNIGHGRFISFYEELKSLVSANSEQVKILRGLNAVINQWQQTVVEPMIVLRRKISAAKTMDDLAKTIASGKGKAYFDDFREALKEFTEEEENLLAARSAKSIQDVNLAFVTIALTLFAAIIIGSSFAFLVGRGITTPIKTLTSAMHALADGDTNTTVPGRERKDELGGMAKTVGEFKENLIENVLLQEATEEAKNVLEKQSAELERSNLELENFAYIASHDLKAPLRGISNLAQWISEDLGDKVGEETRENLVLMHSRVERLESLLNGLLEYSRVGRGDFKPEVVDTRELVSEIVSYLSPPDGCEIEISDTMPTFSTEKAPLEQVFNNLIANAIKHHDKDEIRISVSGKEESKFYSFEVRDDGPGIPEKFHERIFMMFQTLKPRDEMEGSGMGLAMVKKLIEVNDGDIFIESDPDTRNTVFRFTWKKPTA